MARPAHPPDAHLYPNHLTLPTRWRVPHFTDEGLGLACLRAVENERKRIGLDVFAYALMPDHFHLVIGPPAMPVGRVVQALKLASVHRLMADGLSPGGLWQEGYFDVALRDSRQLRAAIEYVHNNPVAAGLAENPAAFRLSSYAAWEGLAEGAIELARDNLVLV